MLALDVVRLEAGLILLEVDYTSARHAMNPEQNYSPGEIGLGRLVDFDKGDFVGRLRARARSGGAAARPRRLVGLAARLVRHRGACTTRRACRRRSARASTASPVPVFAGGRQVGRATSHGWSPILKQAIALASVRAALRGDRHASSRSSGRSRAGAAGSARRSSSCRSSTCRAQARLRSARRPARGESSHPRRADSLS